MLNTVELTIFSRCSRKINWRFTIYLSELINCKYAPNTSLKAKENRNCVSTIWLLLINYCHFFIYSLRVNPTTGVPFLQRMYTHNYILTSLKQIELFIFTMHKNLKLFCFCFCFVFFCLCDLWFRFIFTFDKINLYKTAIKYKCWREKKFYTTNHLY